MDGGTELTCPRHRTPTRLTCVACETPICPRCAIRTEVGLKCPDHATRPPPPARSRFWAIVLPAVMLGMVGLAAVARRVGTGEPVTPTCPTQPAPDVGIGAGRGGPRWTEMSKSPLCGRLGAASAWTGKEVLIWGGQSCAGAACPTDESPRLADGAAYDPAHDRWRRLGPSSLSARDGAAAVWTGGELLVWGGAGREGPLADGAAYEPVAGRWRALVPAPLAPRTQPAAVWTGRELVVWGGGASDGLSDGAAYDPATHRWRRIAAAPLSGRAGSVAVWTGREMVVWGGRTPGGEVSDGAAYDPAADTWRRLSRSPLGGRAQPAAAWTGRELVIWGGGAPDAVAGNGFLADGAAYDPASDTWRGLPPSPAAGRGGAVSVWTGKELLVWGGIGARSPAEAPDPFSEPSLAGALADGAAYDPAVDGWRALEAVGLLGRGLATGAWDGGRMIVWGGVVQVAGAASSAADGALYRP